MTEAPTRASRCRSARGPLAGVARARRWGWRLTVVLSSAVQFTLLSPSPQAQGVAIPAVIVEGRVVAAATGDPIRGAIVRASVVVPPTAGALNQIAPVQVMTDADGRFTIRGLAAGRLNLTASAQGFLTDSYRPTSPSLQPQLRPQETLTDVVIRLERAASIAGVIRDETGAPMPNVTVEIYRRGILTARRAWISRRTPLATDADGRYRSENMPPGEYVVAVPVLATTIPGSVVQAVRALSPAERNSSPIIRSIEASRAPLPGAALVAPDSIDALNVLVMNGMTQGLSAAASDPDGVERVYRTTYFPRATSLNDAGVVPLGSGEQRADIDIDVQTSPRGRIQGTLRGAYGPAGYLGVHLIPRGADELSTDYDGEAAVGVADEAGRFVLADVPHGDYVLKVVVLPRPDERISPLMPPASRLTAWAAQEITVNGEVDAGTIALREPLTVSGQLVFSGTGAAPINLTTRTTVWMAAVEGGMLTPPGAVEVDREGRFTLRGAMAGRYHLWGGNVTGWTVTSVTSEGKDITMAPIVLSDHDVNDVQIKLTSRIVRLDGFAVDSAGAPVANAHVVAFPAEYPTWIAGGLSIRTMRSVRSSASGAFTIAGVPPGGYLLAAFADDQTETWPDRRVVEEAAKAASFVLIQEARPVQRNVTVAGR
jgi:hypothetical protein